MTLLGLVLALPAGFPAPGDSLADPPVRYTIQVTLDERAHRLHGRERIEYHNRSGRRLDRLYLHLYPNSFRDERTAFAREHARLPWALNPLDWIPWGSRRGFLAVQSIRVAGAEAAFTVEETVLELLLPLPIAPGEALTVEVDFTVRLPVMQQVFGFRGKSYVIALWHPKLAVPDSAARDPGRKPAERDFYADWSWYDVRVTAPSGLVVAATGELQSTTDNGDGTSTRRWLADRVRFFAWVADPRYRVKALAWNGATVQYLYIGREDSALAAGARTVLTALDEYSRRYGRYPHRTLVVAETPALGSGIGGVAFSQLVVIPAGLRESPLLRGRYRGALAHEIAHQWWGMSVGVAAERDDWLNEGLSEHVAGELERDHGAPDALGARRREYVNQASFGFDRKVLQAEAEFDDLAVREVALYAKAPFVLGMLQSLVGRDTFDSVVRAYTARYRHRAARTAEFVAVAESVSGRSLAWFFDQWLDGTATCDYGIAGVVVTRGKDGRYRSVIELQRNGGIVMPVEAVVVLANGATFRRGWDGRARSHRMVVDADSPVRSVTVDPDRRLLETRRFDNHYPARVRTSFQPRVREDDAYRIVHLPFLFYDGGLEVGGLLAGGRAPWVVPPALVGSEHFAIVAARYNLATGRTAGTVAYSSPLRWPARRTFWGARATRTRRVESVTVSARAVWGPHFYRAPFHAVSVSLGHERAFTSSAAFDRGRASTVELSYGMRSLVTDFYPVSGGALAVTAEAGWKGWRSDWAFVRVAAQAEVYRRVTGGSKLAVNLFGGTIAAGHAPRQKLLFLAREGNFRSGAVRGTAGEHLTALNAELRVPLGTGTIASLAAFGSFAAYWGAGPEAVRGVRREAGLGLRLFDNAAFALQLDLTVTGRRPGLSLRFGRPFRGPNS